MFASNPGQQRAVQFRTGRTGPKQIGSQCRDHRRRSKGEMDELRRLAVGKCERSRCFGERHRLGRTGPGAGHRQQQNAPRSASLRSRRQHRLPATRRFRPFLFREQLGWRHDTECQPLLDVLLHPVVSCEQEDGKAQRDGMEGKQGNASAAWVLWLHPGKSAARRERGFSRQADPVSAPAVNRMLRQHHESVNKRMVPCGFHKVFHRLGLWRLQAVHLRVVVRLHGSLLPIEERLQDQRGGDLVDNLFMFLARTAGRIEDLLRLVRGQALVP